MTYHYEHWPANHYFLFGGRVMIGSSPGMLLTTHFILAIPFGCFVAWIAPEFHWSITVVASVLLVLTVISLWRCAFTDPGILPRCVAPIAEVTPAPPAQLDVDGSYAKYCDTCHLFRPRRAKHCRHCDVCVLEFDHRQWATETHHSVLHLCSFFLSQF
jgi:palmitoyltransferase ZDHHC9/14/18